MAAKKRKPSEGVVFDVSELAAPLPVTTLGGIMQKIQEVRTSARANGRKVQCSSTLTTSSGNTYFCTLDEGHEEDHRGYRKRWAKIRCTVCHALRHPEEPNSVSPEGDAKP